MAGKLYDALKAEIEMGRFGSLPIITIEGLPKGVAYMASDGGTIRINIKPEPQERFNPGNVLGDDDYATGGVVDPEPKYHGQIKISDVLNMSRAFGLHEFGHFQSIMQDNSERKIRNLERSLRDERQVNLRLSNEKKGLQERLKVVLRDNDDAWNEASRLRRELEKKNPRAVERVERDPINRRFILRDLSGDIVGFLRDRGLSGMTLVNQGTVADLRSQRDKAEARVKELQTSLDAVSKATKAAAERDDYIIQASGV